MFQTWEQQGLNDAQADALAKIAAANAKVQAAINKANATVQRANSKVAAATKKATTATAPRIASVPSTNELIAGARLQWSVMLALPQSTVSLNPPSAFAERTDALRRLIANAGLQQVQVTTSKFDTVSWLAGKLYAGRFVVEVTTPLNRQKKADLHWDLEQLAKQAGLLVDPNPAHNNLAITRQGGNGQQGGLPAESYQRTDAPNNTGLDSFLNGLGLSTPWALFAGAVIVIALVRR